MQKYTVYKEVCWKGAGSQRCDMYAVAENGASIVIETKLSFGLAVIEQAFNWQKHANCVYIAVPAATKRSARTFGYHVCELLGVGVIEVDTYLKECGVMVSSKTYPNPKMPALYEEQKMSVAGNANSQYVTQFKITRNRIYEYMEKNNCVDLSQLVKEIRHHYASNNSAVGSLRKLLEFNAIKGLKLVRNGNRLQVIKDTEQWEQRSKL